MDDSIMMLLEKYLAGTASLAEQQQVEAWYGRFEENEEWLGEGISAKEVIDDLYKRIEADLKEQVEVVWWKRGIMRWSVAAAIILILVSGASLLFMRRHRPEPNRVVQITPDIPPGGNKAILTLGSGQQLILDSAGQGMLAQQGGSQVVKTANGVLAYNKRGAAHAPIVYNTLTTPRGGQYQLTLADGTRVWLNAQSSITYPTVFTGAARSVSISGEVYMEVARDAGRPFKVSADSMQVDVLGTHFNINAYNDEPIKKTTLLEGRVRVINGKKQALLLPGQQALLDKRNDLTITSDIDTGEVMAWKNGYFAFKHMDIPTVMHQVERWYDVTVEYKGEIPDIKFSGEIPRNFTASEVLKILEKATVHFTIDGNKIIVTP